MYKLYKVKNCLPALSIERCREGFFLDCGPPVFDRSAGLPLQEFRNSMDNQIIGY